MYIIQVFFAIILDNRMIWHVFRIYKNIRAGITLKFSVGNLNLNEGAKFLAPDTDSDADKRWYR